VEWFGIILEDSGRGDGGMRKTREKKAHNGKLDAGDARFAQFRVVVDGQVKTLTELGIVSIDLTSNRTAFQFSDGSSIDGVASFTRSDGSKGIAADATLASDAKGGTVTRLTNGSTTVTTAKDASGKITAVTSKVTSAFLDWRTAA